MKFLENDDFCRIIQLTQKFFVNPESQVESFDPNFRLWNIPSEDCVKGKDCLPKINRYLDSGVQTEFLKIIMKRMPLVHYMNDKKPLKLISNSTFEKLRQKYSLSIPCLLITIGRLTYQPEFSQAFRHTVHLATLPFLSHGTTETNQTK